MSNDDKARFIIWPSIAASSIPGYFNRVGVIVRKRCAEKFHFEDWNNDFSSIRQISFLFFLFVFFLSSLLFSFFHPFSRVTRLSRLPGLVKGTPGILRDNRDRWCNATLYSWSWSLNEMVSPVSWTRTFNAYIPGRKRVPYIYIYTVRVLCQGRVSSNLHGI